MRKMMLSAEDLATFHRIVFSAAGDESCRGNDIRWMARKIQELQPSAEELMRYRLKRLRTAEKLCQYRVVTVLENGENPFAWQCRERDISISIGDLLDELADLEARRQPCPNVS